MSTISNASEPSTTATGTTPGARPAMSVGPSCGGGRGCRARSHVRRSATTGPTRPRARLSGRRRGRRLDHHAVTSWSGSSPNASFIAEAIASSASPPVRTPAAPGAAPKPRRRVPAARSHAARPAGSGSVPSSRALRRMLRGPNPLPAAARWRCAEAAGALSNAARCAIPIPGGHPSRRSTLITGVEGTRVPVSSSTASTTAPWGATSTLGTSRASTHRASAGSVARSAATSTTGWCRSRPANRVVVVDHRSCSGSIEPVVISAGRDLVGPAPPASSTCGASP